MTGPVPKSRDAAAVYEAVFDALSDAAAVIDAEFRLVAANARFRDLFGARAAPGLPVDALLSDPADAPGAPWRGLSERTHAIDASTATGASRLEAQTRPLPGDARLVLLRPARDGRARRAQISARLADAFAEPRSGAFGVDFETGEAAVSEFLARLLHLDAGRTTLPLGSFADAIHPEDRIRIEALRAGPWSAFDPAAFRFRIAGPDGGWRWIKAEGVIAEVFEDGRARKVSGSVSDAQDLAEAETGRAVAETRLDLAAALGELHPWRYDFDAAEGWIEGPLSERIAPGRFGPAALRALVHPDDFQSLNAAFLATSFGGRLDQSARLSAPGGGWEHWRFAGEREPGGGRHASGFVKLIGAEPHNLDLRASAASARMGAWSYDIPNKRMTLEGPLLAVLGLPQPTATLPIAEWRARVRAEDLWAMDEATAALVETGVTETEYRVRAADGSYVWLGFRGGISEQAPDGALLRFSGFFSEATDRRRLERELAWRERQLNDAVDAGLLGTWSVDLVSGRQTAFGQVALWMGKTPGDTEITREDWLKVIHPDDHAIAREAYDAITSGDAFRSFDYRILAPDGQRTARATGRIVSRAVNGRPLRAAGVIVDVSAERAYEQAIEAEKTRFESLYRNAPVLMAAIDADGRIAMVSDYTLARLDYPRDAVIGAHGRDFFAGEDAARVLGEVLPRSRAAGRLDGEIVYLKSRGGRPIETRMSLFWETGPDGEPVRAHCAFAEIGDLNAAHRELERRAGALERANRELDRFATVASHDMQEPLRKISAFASLLKTRWHGKIDADADRCLDYLVDAAGRMRRLIDDLLAYSRASSRPFEPQTVDLNAIWRDVAEAYEMLIEEAEAALEIGPLPIVTGDRVLLQLLFANLLTNAIKYRKGQGVRVSLFAEPAEGGRVRLIFSDDGIGFEPRFAEKVFEPFSRLHPRDEYGGTGIGLAICQQAVERQHGSIRVDSAPGEGTRFIVELPGTVAGRGAEDAA